MSKFLAGLGGNAGAIAAGAVTVAVLGTGVFINNAREGAEIVQPAALVQPTEDSVQAPKIEEATAEDNTPSAPEAVAETQAPAFDEVRRETDGMTVVAGRAAPGATVQLLRDGEVIATTIADGSGKFATLVSIPPDGQAHVLSLSQNVDGTDIASLDEIILAPTEAPIVVAEVVAEVPGQNVAVVAEPEAKVETVAEVAQAAEPSFTEADPKPLPETAENVEVIETTQVTAPTSEPAKTTEVVVLKATAEGVELLNPDAPDVMDTVALDTIGYSSAGDVQLSGRAQADAQTVRVYLDNDSVVTLPVDDQGRWRGDVPDVDEGIYTLRVDEVGSDGTVTSRIETPFKRESAAVLTQAAATQDGPIKAITVQTGATLWAIARDRYGDGQLYLRVVAANESAIRDPDLIYPGQVFDLPD